MNALERVVDDLKTVEGCLGAIVIKGTNCLASSLPAVVTAARLQQVASGVARWGALAEKAGYGEPNFVVKGDKATLLAFATGTGTFVVMVCSPQTERATVELFAGVAIDDVRAADAAIDAAITATEGTSDEHRSDEQLAQAREAVYSSHRGELEGLRELLVSHVGPIGVWLFDRHLDGWLNEEGSADWERSHALRTRLCNEIEDESARSAFFNAAYWPK